MKQTAQNTFADGLNLDLHPIVTPNSVLTDNLNGTFITYNGNEFCLQNDRGNTIKATLTEDFVPIGIKEHNGILYIVSHNPKTGEGEIGTYPGSFVEENFEVEFDLQYDTYTPLMNGRITNETHWQPLRTDSFNFDLNNPVSIEIQDSYDGSVNLILTDGKNPPRLVNTGFSVLPANKFKYVQRTNNSNLYNLDDTFSEQIKLIKNSVAFTKFDLDDVVSGGELKGGNYTFYLKYGDDDENLTDIVCQSGIVCIYKGFPKFNTDKNALSGIKGTLADELTEKAVRLTISNLDKNYSRFYLYYSREYSDTQGYSMSETAFLKNPYKYDSETNSITITINGTEPITSVSEEDLNIVYHSVDSVKTATQQSDMLFLGNVKTELENYTDLKDISLRIRVDLNQNEEGYTVGLPNKDGSNNKLGYADPKNVYYNLGYWCKEFYRLGIVYILEDGTITNVYNLRGNVPIDNDLTGNDYGIFRFNKYSFSPYDVYPEELRDGTEFQLNWFSIILDQAIKSELKTKNIIGYFIVRQKRHPVTLCQGVAIPTDSKKLGIPLIPRRISTDDSNESAIREIWIGLDYDDSWAGVTQSILGQTLMSRTGALKWDYRMLGVDRPGFEGAMESEEAFIKWANNEQTRNYDSFMETHLVSYLASKKPASQYENFKWFDGLISADPIFIPNVRNILSDYNANIESIAGSNKGFHFNNNITGNRPGKKHYLYDLNVEYVGDEITDDFQPVERNNNLTFIPSNTVQKFVYEKPHATVIGNASSVSDFGVLYSTFMEREEKMTSGLLYNLTIGYPDNINCYSIIRGNFIPFIGSSDGIPAIRCNNANDTSYLTTICNIKRKTTDAIEKEYLKNDQSPYYAITNRRSLDDLDARVFGGDCYICRVWLRYIWNFIGSSVPQNVFLNSNFKLIGMTNTAIEKSFDQADWSKVNLADVNNVPLGLWITYVCHSNYNLQIRCIDDSDTYMSSFMGTNRTFYPYEDISTLNQYKQEESHLLNAGYSTTVGKIRYDAPVTVPYTKNEFSNRIMFSNKNVNDAFVNGYRTFQGLSYRDYDKQYGEIVKLLPLTESLFCVMTHGLALVPVNERALIQTTTDQTIHIYGHGVLPDNITIVSSDYGSKYEESVVKTPIGIYGIDTSAKKIWRYSEKRGFETLSDMKIESFLNKNLDSEYLVEIQNCDIRTHYNAFKGDVIFTWYNNVNDELKLYSICYNERQSKWTTRYDWVPLVSENVNGAFFSLQEGEDSDGQIGVYSHEVSESSPTKWYGKQHQFEYEFVVSDPIGAHKIYENLQIISNNVQPEELQFEFIGDAYMFNKARIYHTVFHEPTFTENRYFKNEVKDTKYETDPTKDSTKYSKPQVEYAENLGYHPFRNGSKLNDRDDIIYGEVIKTPNATEQYHLRIPQECRNIETWGRRLGNIHYKKDSWFTTIEPIVYDANLNDPNSVLSNDEVKWNSARIRDKWCKIRVRYFGEDLAVITAIKTIVNI